jgi:hypothetical protein
MGRERTTKYGTEEKMIPKSESNTFLHVRVPASLLKATKKLADNDDMPLSVFIRRMLLAATRKAKAKK